MTPEPRPTAKEWLALQLDSVVNGANTSTYRFNEAVGSFAQIGIDGLTSEDIVIELDRTRRRRCAKAGCSVGGVRVSNLFRHDATTANKMCDGLLARITASGDIWLVLFEVKENRTGQAMKQVRCGHCFFEYVLSIYASVESGATKIKDVQYVVLGIGMPTKAVIGYKRDDPCKPEGIRTVYLSPQGRVSVASLFAP